MNSARPHVYLRRFCVCSIQATSKNTCSVYADPNNIPICAASINSCVRPASHMQRELASYTLARSLPRSTLVLNKGMEDGKDTDTGGGSGTKYRGVRKRPCGASSLPRSVTRSVAAPGFGLAHSTRPRRPRARMTARRMRSAAPPLCSTSPARPAGSSPVILLLHRPLPRPGGWAAGTVKGSSSSASTIRSSTIFSIKTSMAVNERFASCMPR